jgi:hypothetical protein
MSVMIFKSIRKKGEQAKSYWVVEKGREEVPFLRNQIK